MSSFVAPIDAIALKPAWPALFASVRFARWSRWQFGNDSGVLRCLEPAPRRRLTERAPNDPLRMRFDLRRWASAYARSTGSAREIGFIADDGSPIASLHLAAVDPAIDELIWRLIDDDAGARAMAPVAPVDPARVADELALCESRDAFDARTRSLHLSRDEAFALAGPTVARRLASSVLPLAFRTAQRAGLALRLRVENTGGGITWIPGAVDFNADATRMILRAGAVEVLVPTADARIWAVALETADACCPAIECCVAGDRGWIRLDVVAETGDACTIWRRICATLPEE
jgi:putative heme degradation protein